MKLLALQLTDWRNIKHALVELHPRINVFSGDNAQGKTNLLEAVYFLATLRSFRAGKTEELIRFERAQAQIRARVERRALERLLEVTVRPGQRVARVDGKAVRAAADWFGGFNAVLFSPEDLRLPKGSPAARRRFLDRAVFHAQPGFLKLAQEYEKLLRSRNALLREAAGASPEAALLETYDERLSEVGGRIVSERTRYVSEIGAGFAAAYEAVTHSGLAAQLRYQAAASDAAAIRRALADGLRRDRARGFTSAGPHTDDLELVLEGRSARLYGSQGQLRALVLALKIAEIQHLEKRLGETPVLMLDDVSSELDPQRNRYLFEFIGGMTCQCVITTTDPAHILLTEYRKDFQVVNGDFQGANSLYNPGLSC
ncbi:MAG TPA: DNA replication/repair protein RecF [Polyangia bacterium]|nr:DNA replication/repair protein RecF [Polyangia bacterium]